MGLFWFYSSVVDGQRSMPMLWVEVNMFEKILMVCVFEAYSMSGSTSRPLIGLVKLRVRLYWNPARLKASPYRK